MDTDFTPNRTNNYPFYFLPVGLFYFSGFQGEPPCQKDFGLSSWVGGVADCGHQSPMTREVTQEVGAVWAFFLNASNG